MKAVTAGKTLYGLPTSNYTQGLIYNRKLFTEAGLNPNSPPTTWAQVETDATAIAKLGQRHRGLGRLQRGQQRRLALLLLHGRARRHDGQQQQRRRRRRASTTPTAWRSCTALHTLRFTDNAMSPTQGLAWGTLQQQFAAGKLGMYIAAPDDIYNVIVPTDKGNLSDIGMGPLPSLTGTPAGSLSRRQRLHVLAKHDTPAQIAAGIKWHQLRGPDARRRPVQLRPAEGGRLHRSASPSPQLFDGATGTKINQLRTKYATINSLVLHVRTSTRSENGDGEPTRRPGRLQDA